MQNIGRGESKTGAVRRDHRKSLGQCQPVIFEKHLVDGAIQFQRMSSPEKNRINYPLVNQRGEC